MDQIIVWLHLLSLAAYAGLTLALVAVILPAVDRVPEHPDRLRLLESTLSRWNPLVIAVLGVLVMTGAFSLTRYKADLGAAFFSRIGEPLALKLGLAFLLINGATYTVFGLAHRIVRSVTWDDPLPPERLAGMLRRLRMASWLNLALVAWITWVALAIPTRL